MHSECVSIWHMRALLQLPLKLVGISHITYNVSYSQLTTGTNRHRLNVSRENASIYSHEKTQMSAANDAEIFCVLLLRKILLSYCITVHRTQLLLLLLFGFGQSRCCLCNAYYLVSSYCFSMTRRFVYGIC